MSQKRSGFEPGFSKTVEAILIAADRGHLYPHEVRANLRLAGMHLDEHIELPEFEVNIPEPGEDFEDEEYVTEEEDTDGR